MRLELGLPGAAILAVILGWFFYVGAGRLGGRFANALATGAACSYLTVASVSYGIWQNWWVAFAWALAALTVMAVAPVFSRKTD